MVLLVRIFFGHDHSMDFNQKFSYFEDLFAKDAGTPNLVNVASKAYRGVSTSHWPVYLLPLILFFTQLALTKVLDSISSNAIISDMPSYVAWNLYRQAFLQ